ncbi:MAG: winged helix-turn-helix domain-containing protein [Acidobacteriota bacterium]
MSALVTNKPLLASDFTVGDWLVEPRELRIRRGGEDRALSPMQMDLLVFLCARPGALVSKAELLAAVWRGAEVEDGALARCVSELRQLLGDSAKNPDYIETVRGRGYRLVAVVESPAVPEAPSEERRPRRPPWVAVLLALLVLAGAWGVIGLLKGGAPLIPATGNGPVAVDVSNEPMAARRTVAVLRFENLTGATKHDWMTTGLAESLSAELAAAPELRVVPTAAVRSVERKLSTDPSDDEQGHRYLSAALGVDLVVFGSFLADGQGEQEALRINVWVKDTSAPGGLQEVLIEERPADELLQTLALVGARLRASLGLGGEAIRRPLGDEHARSRSSLAARLFHEGQWLLQRHRAAAARAKLEMSIAEDPSQPLAHLALSKAWSELGDYHEARRVAATALELAPGLPNEQRLWVEAGASRAARSWEAALESIGRSGCCRRRASSTACEPLRPSCAPGCSRLRSTASSACAATLQPSRTPGSS